MKLNLGGLGVIFLLGILLLFSVPMNIFSLLYV
jgi:hypothetical protein